MSRARQSKGELETELSSRPAGVVEAVAGIVEAAPSGPILAGNIWTVIGTIILRHGKVTKVPRRFLDERQRAALDAAADAVWLRGRSALTGWQSHPKLGWVTAIRCATYPR